MSNQWLKYGIKVVLILLIQVLIFQRMVFGWGGVNYVQIFIYPILIMGLPIKSPSSLVVALGFLIGLVVDIFYMSPGVHAGALTLTAFLRAPVLAFLEPRTGYNVDVVPSKFYLGLNWYMSYAGVLLFIHIFTYYTLEIFTFVFFLEIWMKTLFTLVFTLIFAVMYQFLLDPKS